MIKCAFIALSNFWSKINNIVNNMKFYKIVQYLVVGSFLFFSQNFVFASNLGIAVDQTAIVFDADSGENQEFIIKIKNISDEEYNIKIDKNDYILGDNNEVMLSSNDDELGGLKDWLSVKDDSIILAPGAESEVIFDVNVPENASIGSHKGAVIFRVEPGGDETVKVHGQLGVHVLINVKGDTHASGRVNSFDIPLITTGNLNYISEFENTGNIHYVPYGEVVVQNVFTKKEQMYKYDKHFVFPGNTFTFSLNEAIPSLFGLYKARVTFVDGEGATRTKIDYSMGYFFPLIAIVVVGVIITIIWKMRKKNKNHVKIDKNNKIKSIKKDAKKRIIQDNKLDKRSDIKKQNDKSLKININTE